MGVKICALLERFAFADSSCLLWCAYRDVFIKIELHNLDAAPFRLNTTFRQTGWRVTLRYPPVPERVAIA